MIDKIRSLKNGEEVDWGDIHTVGVLTIIVGEIDYGFDYRGMQELTAKLAIVYKANNDSGGFVLDSNDAKSAAIDVFGTEVRELFDLMKPGIDLHRN
ncbi:MAG: hypothetical protein MK109_08485 [Dehalococcoidia bacterium]|nr:hypothetical protein [Dehalococcoidia bacterium]